ncbi:hypothetical protein HanHA300_Chr13g0502051 [Helianthus annuus]|nr:hypothetical protein HanHA300_Chr13g0502051 [Helianthus annuus]KAJ0665519.1 hypothetical protein HanLR1_Chr13g0504771 [Helianthus annuus]KAJ0672964.1 hypothetical protein HanOQP8_Chr13g0502991 [Helianthus annuus]
MNPVFNRVFSMYPSITTVIDNTQYLHEQKAIDKGLVTFICTRGSKMLGQALWVTCQNRYFF